MKIIIKINFFFLIYETLDKLERKIYMKFELLAKEITRKVIKRIEERKINTKKITGKVIKGIERKKCIL